MTGMHIAHLFALGLWGGLVAAEIVVEVLGWRGEPESAFAARAHVWIDRVFELPILAAILVSGFALVLRTPMTAALFLKVILGLAAIGVNLWCALAVERRGRLKAGTPEALAETRRVKLSVYLGVPPATAALYLGLRMAL